jgi:hypothetical protein
MIEQDEFPKRVYLGNNSGERIYLSAPSWDCEWYWGFGYLGNNRCHYHVDGLKNPTWFDFEKSCWQSEHLNLFDGFKKHFGDSLVIKDAQLWTLCELFESFYALRKAAEVLGRGGAHYANNPAKETIKNPTEVERINKIVLPKIFREIYKILRPE